MFGLLTRARRRRTPPARPAFRPCLESLETRDCPSALTLNYASNGGNSATLSGQLTGAATESGQTINVSGYGGNTTATTDANGNYSVTVTVTQQGNITAGYQGQTPSSASVTPGTSPGNAAPTLSLNYAYTSGNNATLSGTLSGTANNAGQTISLGGYGNSTTTTTDANGNFSVNVAIIQSGTVWATYPPSGQIQVMTSVAVPPPPSSSANLTLAYNYTSGNNVTFYGQLSGAANNAGQTINLGGYGGTTTATTDSNGNYSVTQLGTVTAGYAPSGQQAVTATVNVNPTAPTITNFTASQEPGGYWEFEGTVTGTPDPQGMTITLGGLSAIQGSTITVEANGTFDESFQLNGQTGTVIASTTDWWGRQASAQDLLA